MKLVIDIPQGMIAAFSHEEQWTAVLCHDMSTVLQKGTPYKERPKGKWINFNSYFRKCSLCQKIVGFDYIEQNGERFNFCPFCGADMRGDV